MELDDFKQAWKQAEIKNNTKPDVMEIIQHKSYGPIAALKREFKKQIIVMTLLPVVLLLTVAGDLATAVASVLFWAYIAFCVSVIILATLNYRTADKMIAMDGAVKSNLKQQIDILEMRITWKIRGLRVALLFFIVLIEIVPYFQHYRMLDKWHSLPQYMRFGSYAILFLFQYFVGRKVIYRKFGSHVDYLKDLVRGMD
jgi:hypothetical protein